MARTTTLKLRIWRTCPDTFVRHALDAIPRPAKAAIVTSLVAGLLFHLQALTGLLVNWDSVQYVPRLDTTYMYTQGKWFIGVVDGLSDYIHVGALGGLLAIGFISLAAGIVVCILQISRSLYGAMIGAIMVAMPSVMCTFGYAVGNIYFGSLLLAVLSVWFCRQGNWWFLSGGLLLILSLGTYQAHVGTAAGLLVIACVKDLLSDTLKSRQILLNGTKYIAWLCLSVAAYYLVVRIVLQATGAQLSSYRGIDTMGSIDFPKFPTLLYETYQKVLEFFYFDTYGVGTPRHYWPYRVVTLCGIAAVTLLACHNRKWRKPQAALLVFVLLIVALPLSMHIIALLGQNARTHWMMCYPFVLGFLAPIVFGDMCCTHFPPDLPFQGSLSRSIYIFAGSLQWILTLATAMVLFNWFIVCNSGYLRMRLAYEGAYATCIQIAERITSSRDFSPKVRVAVIGVPAASADDSLKYMSRFTGIPKAHQILGSTRRINRILTNFLGFNFHYVSPAKADAIKKHSEFLSMPIFPADSCVRTIDGVIVVRLAK